MSCVQLQVRRHRYTLQIFFVIGLKTLSPLHDLGISCQLATYAAPLANFHLLPDWPRGLLKTKSKNSHDFSPPQKVWAPWVMK